MESIDLLKKVIKANMDVTRRCADCMDNPETKDRMLVEAATFNAVLMLIEDEKHLHQIAKILEVE